MVLVAVVLVLGSLVRTWADVPETWMVGRDVSRWISDGVKWAVRTFDPVFGAINIILLRYFLIPIEKFLLFLPWWLIYAVVGVVAYVKVDRKFGIVALAMMMGLAVLGLHDFAMSTLTLIIVSTILCVGLGLPLGIFSAKSDGFDASMRPLLDAMQTMPSFVYLIPAIMLFGIGMVPAVMATLIYAIPPMIRLTNLGIRQVDPDVVEAASAFGSTPTQILVKVQFPMALPTIMAGINQTIMMALAMVVVASMIGARGLGVEVFNGIARLDTGRGFLGGLGIVVMAIIIDRISQSLAKPTQTIRTV